MELRRQLTGALAWAGLVLIIAVPSAEIVRAKFFSKDAVVVTSDVADTPVVTPAVKPKPKPATVASTAPQPALKAITVPVTPIVVAPTNGGDAVKDYIAANKKLPDYITGSTSTKPVASAPVQQLPAAVPAAAPTAVATIAPAPTTVVTPAPVTPTAVDPTSVASIEPQPVIPDVPPVPMPASARPKPQPVSPTVTEADLKDWKSGSLEDYLKAHGLLAASAANTDGPDTTTTTTGD